MAVYLHHIEPLVPEGSYLQSDLGALMKQQFGTTRRLERLIHSLYRQSGIAKRHSVLEAEFTVARPDLPTSARNKRYAQEASRLSFEVACRALQQTPFQASEISHVITVSCTGFFAPGPDQHLIKALGLKVSTERYHLGFMGCYAALPALKLARTICTANPEAVVLLVCVELCSLHLQASSELDDLLAASLFADGAAAAIVSSQKPEKGLCLETFASSLIPETEAEMAWTIGDTGFKMMLSSYVPDLLASSLQGAIVPLLDQLDLVQDDIDFWAIHPGGRAILDKLERALGLGPAQLSEARAVLRNYGNMSSPTVLFVLAEILAKVKANERILAMAFGPGLTVESALLRGV